jgi:hypothetical protein
MLNEDDLTIRLSSDPVSCFDGVATGPGIPADTGAHMYKCFDDPGAKGSSAKPHQQWAYDKASKTLRLIAATKMSCKVVANRGE